MVYESEKQTRKLRIDALLEKAGWKLLLYSEEIDLTSLSSYAIEECSEFYYKHSN